MNRLFNMDNKFFTFMARIADLVILNFLFLICCIPIVTIGASLTSMYYVTLKIARNEESYIVRSFFKSFKQNFKQSTVIWLIMLAGGIVLYIDYRITGQMEGTLVEVIRYGLYVITLIYAFLMLYLFPLQSKFFNTMKSTFKNALLMSIRHLPFTVLMLLITVVPMSLTLTFTIVFVYGTMVWIFLGFALTAYLDSIIMMKVFDHYIPKEEEASEKDTDDLSATLP